MRKCHQQENYCKKTKIIYDHVIQIYEYKYVLLRIDHPK